MKFKEALREVRPEMRKLRDECLDAVHSDHLWEDYQSGDYETIWTFNSEKDISDWEVTSDNDNNQGKTKASLNLSRNNTALFQGYLNTEVPQDGVTVYSGYASMKSPFNIVSSSNF